ncbi:unnamed protein product [Cuscuta epithymum]|uniref:Uncharacterized protein n=1 Tax=Cuscuta epithymum TaxID=186058 RepID=A0AAV0CCL2_9ASTE|nr:unnamed protein product [Cuscuta epithymum]
MIYGLFWVLIEKIRPSITKFSSAIGRLAYVITTAFLLLFFEEFKNQQIWNGRLKTFLYICACVMYQGVLSEAELKRTIFGVEKPNKEVLAFATKKFISMVKQPDDERKEGVPEEVNHPDDERREVAPYCNILFGYIIKIHTYLAS